MTPAYEPAPCPVCASSDFESVAGPESIRDEIERLWKFHERRLRPDTPPERLADRVAFSQDPPWRLVRCRSCTLLYRNPRERPRELEQVYAGEEPDPAALDALFENQCRSYRLQARRLTRLVGRAGSGLEVGSYVGGFLAAAGERGWQVTGVDINESAVTYARARGFSVHLGDLASTPERPHDAVAIWNCFEQLADPRGTAVAARARLAASGIFAIRTPNAAFYLRLRPLLAGAASGAATALLAHNNLLSFPYRVGFTLSALRRLLASTGFRMVRAYGDPLVPVADEWTRGWAALEERVVKAALRPLGLGRSLSAGTAPWLEVYARLA